MKCEQCKMIIVDDQKNIRFLLKKVADSLGIQVVGEAEDGRQGVELYKEQAPDLVLMDVSMPKMSGPEALRAVRTLDPDANVVMLSSVSDKEVITACLANGATNYILKDNKLSKIKEVLVETIKDILYTG